MLHGPLTPPRALRPDMPRAYEGVTLRAPAKEPVDRFASAAAFARALEAATTRVPAA